MEWEDYDEIQFRQLQYRLAFVFPKGESRTLEWEEQFRPANSTNVIITRKSVTVVGTGLPQYTATMTIDPPTEDGETEVVVPKTTCGGGACPFGSGELGDLADAGGVDFRMSLGRDLEGYHAGQLILVGSSYDDSLLTPQRLVAIHGPDVTVLTNGNGVIEQMVTPSGLVVISITSGSSYQIILFSSIGTFNPTTGLYEGYTNELTRYTVSSPAPNHVEIVSSHEYIPAAEYAWTGSGWNLALNGTEVQRLTRDGLVETYEVMESGTTVYRESREYTTTNDFTFLTARELGSSGYLRRTEYAYNMDTNSPAFGKLARQINPNGSWESCAYNANGLLVMQTNSLLNASTSAATNAVRLTVYDYTTLAGTDDDGSMEPDSPRTIREYLFGQLVSCRYLIITPSQRTDIIAYIPTAAWNNVNNMVTISRNYVCTNDQNLVTVSNTRNADGTYQISETWTNSGVRYIVVSSGESTNGESIYNGTQTISCYDAQNLLTSQMTMILVNGAVTATNAYETFQYDENGRRTLTSNVLAGNSTSRIYDCCLLQSTVDLEGVTNTFVYDDLKRLTITFRNGITNQSVLDAAGNVLVSYTIGTQANRLTNYTALYNLAGETVRQTDARGYNTTFTNYVSGDYQVQKTVNPDNSDRLEWYFKDGQLYEVTGTAATPIRYSYGADSEGAYTLEIKMNGTSTNEWTLTYQNAFGQVKKIVRPTATGGTTTHSFAYNNKGQLTSETDPDGVVTEYDYNALGEQYRRTVGGAGGRSLVTSRDYYTSDSQKYQRIKEYAVGTGGSNLVSESWMRVDGLESQTLIADGASNLVHRSSTVYYPATQGRVVTSTAPDSTYSVSAYTNGFLVSVNRYDHNHNHLSGSSFGYDEFGRQQTVTDARTGTQTKQILGPGELVMTNLVIATDLTTQTNRYTYDNRGRRQIAFKPDGTYEIQTYFTTGLPDYTSGTQVYPLRQKFDAHGRMTNLITYPSAAVTTVWNYDPYTGRLQNKKYATSVAGPTYTYTPAGRLATRTWAREVTTTYTTNSLGEVAEIGYGTNMNSVQFSRDVQGRVTNVVNGSATVGLTLNAAGRVVSEMHTGGPLGGSSTWDTYLRQTQPSALRGFKNLSDLYWFTYHYDDASRLYMASAGVFTVTYNYHPTSSLISSLVFKSNGVEQLTISRDYDALNRLTNMVNTPTTGVPISFAYAYDLMNRRTNVTLADGSGWAWQYNGRGELTNAVRKWADGTQATGQQFGFNFDGIGNRNWSRRDGRQSDYTVNNLFQYTSRTVPGYANILGSANSAATVTVNDLATSRKGDYYRLEMAVTNSTAPLWLGVTNLGVMQQGTNADIVVTNQGWLFAPKTPEAYTYDLDGNMTSDGRWTNRWDAENRLIEQETLPAAYNAGAPRQKVMHGYDWMGRRISKTVSNYVAGAWQLATDHRFLYDGWNLMAIWDGTTGTSLAAFIWGTDLSGSMQGAGGVGGLLGMFVQSGPYTGTYFYCYDGNGNVVGLVNAANGQWLAEYEYGPFGELLRATGPLAFINPFRFSTKYQDDETGFLYYGYRFYDPSIGRWVSRDPIHEIGGLNVYGFVRNNAITGWDVNGLLDCRCSESDCSGLRDITDILNAKINADIKRAAFESRDNADFMRRARDMFSKDIDHAWSQGLTTIDGWIQDLGDLYRKSKEKRAHGFGGVFDKKLNYRFASCIKLTCNGKTRCIGSDKISHFMQQGFMLYEISQKLDRNYAQAFSYWTEGILTDPIIHSFGDGSHPFAGAIMPPVSQQPLNNIQAWLTSGSFNFYGFKEEGVSQYYQKWGMIGGGSWPSPPSLADHNVNMYGMDFWNRVSDLGATRAFPWMSEERGRVTGHTLNICDFIKDLDSIVGP